MNMFKRITSNGEYLSSIMIFSFLIFFTITLNLDKGLENYNVFGQATASENLEQSIPANKVKSYQALSLENGNR